MIAVTAVINDVTVVTRNVQDFDVQKLSIHLA